MLAFNGSASIAESIGRGSSKRSFIVLAAGQLDVEDEEREDVMPIPFDHMFILKGAVKRLLLEKKVDNTSAVWLTMRKGENVPQDDRVNGEGGETEEILMSKWFSNLDPFDAEDTITLHVKKPSSFKDSHASTMFIQDGLLWFSEEERAARMTAKNFQADEQSVQVCSQGETTPLKAGLVVVLIIMSASSDSVCLHHFSWRPGL